MSCTGAKCQRHRSGSSDMVDDDGCPQRPRLVIKVYRRTSCKVLCLASLVRPHNRQPPIPIDIITSHGRLALFECLDRPLRDQAHAQTWRRAETLLSGRNDHVQAPVVEPDLLGRDRAHGVEGDERVGRVLLDERSDVRCGGQDAGGCVNCGSVCVNVGMDVQCGQRG
jgi:hypothetical protein